MIRAPLLVRYRQWSDFAPGEPACRIACSGAASGGWRFGQRVSSCFRLVIEPILSAIIAGKMAADGLPARWSLRFLRSAARSCPVKSYSGTILSVAKCFLGDILPWRILPWQHPWPWNVLHKSLKQRGICCVTSTRAFPHGAIASI